MQCLTKVGKIIFFCFDKSKVKLHLICLKIMLQETFKKSILNYTAQVQGILSKFGVEEHIKSQLFCCYKFYYQLLQNLHRIDVASLWEPLFQILLRLLFHYISTSRFISLYLSVYYLLFQILLIFISPPPRND